jgi:hypothetical protein
MVSEYSLYRAPDELGGLMQIYGISIAISILSIIAMWKIFEKAGEPGWASIVPIYNTYVLFKIVFGDGLKMLLLLIPIVNIIYSIKLSLKLATVFGKSTGFGIGLLFLTPIFELILAFGDAEYAGPVNE